VTRRATAMAVVIVALVVAAAALLVRSGDRREPPSRSAAVHAGLLLFVVNDETGPLVAVVGSDGGPRPGAVAVPADLPITIPGQGDGTVADAVTQPGAVGQVAVSNLLGMWIDYRAVTTVNRLGRVVDRADGIEFGGRTESGAEVRASLSVGGEARELAWRTVLAAMLGPQIRWELSDFSDIDDLAPATRILFEAEGTSVAELPTEVSAGGQVEPNLGSIETMVHEVFGASNHEVVPVVVLNGSGAPGVGQRVARLVVPGGFQVVISGNASSFDHDTTVVVVGSPTDRDLGERVRNLLGVGQVAVSGPPSGLADVTIVIGKDFGAG
jgi:hypothetical protein